MIEASLSYWEVPTPEDADFVALVHAEIEAAHARVNATLPSARMRRRERERPAPTRAPRPRPQLRTVPDMPLERRRELVRDRVRAGCSVSAITRELDTYAAIVYGDIYWWCRQYGVDGGVRELRALLEPVAA